MLMRAIGIAAVLFALSFVPAHALCGPDTPPAAAAARGLTCEVFVDNFTTTASIDTGNTLNPASCTGATFPNGVCHWYVNNAWAASPYTACGGNTGSFQCTRTLPPTTTFDYSTSGAGLLLQPQNLTVTANTVSGSNQLTNISNVTGVANLGNAVVRGPGIPFAQSLATSFTLAGTTATMSANATSTNTGGTYVLGNVHNGWMFQTCGYSPTAPGWVGTTFTGDFYVQVVASASTTRSPNHANNESEAEAWAWPVELFAGTQPAFGSTLKVMEFDFFDTFFDQRVIYNEEIANDGSLAFVQAQNFGGPYYQFASSPEGNGPYGTLVMSPGSNAGGAGIGIVAQDNGGTVFDTMSYGPAITPTSTSHGSLSSLVGAFTLLPQQHYCLMLDAAPNWPMTVSKVAVWQAPPSTAGGAGRRSIFR